MILSSTYSTISNFFNKVYSQNTAFAYFMDKEKTMDISCKQQSGFCDYKNIMSKKQKRKKGKKPETTNYKRITRLAD